MLARGTASRKNLGGWESGGGVLSFREQLEQYKSKGAESFSDTLSELIQAAKHSEVKEDYIYFVSEICIDLKRFETAIELLNLIERRFGLSDVGWNLVAFCNWEFGQEDAAYDSYEKSVALNPENVSSRRGACFLAIEKDHDERAVEHCRVFYEKSGGHEAALWYGTALYNLNRQGDLKKLVDGWQKRHGFDAELSSLMES
jgi:tetratricopeptide (TPR) repeat protein